MDTAYDFFGRPHFDLYFMKIAFMVASRSLDPSTKCGCVLVSPGRNIIATGYNGPPGGCDDTKIPLERPEKYKYMEHAERNAIYSAAKHGVSLQGSTCYVTGFPCLDCYRGLIQSGIAKTIYYPFYPHMCQSPEYQANYRNFQGHKMSLEVFQFPEEISS